MTEPTPEERLDEEPRGDDAGREADPRLEELEALDDGGEDAERPVPEPDPSDEE